MSAPEGSPVGEHEPIQEYLKPVIELVRNAGLFFGCLAPDTGWPSDPEEARGRPRFFIIADWGETTLGPDGFHRKSLRRVLRGAEVVVVHCGADEPDHYEGAATLAVQHSKCVLIQPRPSHETTWIRFVSRHVPKATLFIFTMNQARYLPDGGTA